VTDPSNKAKVEALLAGRSGKQISQETTKRIEAS